MKSGGIDRRTFLERHVGTGGRVIAGRTGQAAPVGTSSAAGGGAAKKTRVGVIGCGSVSHRYLPHLAECPYVEVVSTCDIIPERAADQAKNHNVPNQLSAHSKMLAGAEFDLLVNLTDMQEHEHLNREAIAAGKHVWSEKPIANSLAAGQEMLEARAEKGRARVGCAGRGHQPAVRFHGQDAERRVRWAASPRRTPTTATRARPGRRSSTKKGAAACPTWASTT